MPSPGVLEPPQPLSTPPGDPPPAAAQEPPHDARRARERFDLLLSQLSAEFSAAQLGAQLQLVASGETGLPANSTGLASRAAPPSIQLEQEPSADVAWDAPSPVADRELLTPLAQVGESPQAVGRSREDKIERPLARSVSPGSQAEVRESHQAAARKSERKAKGPFSSPSPTYMSQASNIQEPFEVARPLKRLMRNMNSVSAKAVTDAVQHLDPGRDLMSNRPRDRVQRMLNSSWFDFVMGCVIFANSIEIGVESSYRLNGIEVPAFAVLEWVFLIAYVVELGLRIFAFGRHCFANGWVQFDAVLVVVGLVGLMVVPVIVATEGASDIGLPGPLMVLRVFRLFRLARAVRLLVQFRTLWLLLKGLFASAGTMVYTFCLLIVILYIFSCIAMEMITIPWSTRPPDQNPEVKMLVDKHWPDLPTSMLSLLQFVFFDSIASIYTPMIREDFKLLIFFIPFLMIVSIALMNLVTAVLVEGSLSQASTDKEEQLEAMLAVLKEAFELMDVNHSGTVNWQEVQAVNKEGQAHLKKYLGGESLLELFEMLDTGESGEVDIESFCHGISRLAASGKPIEFFRLLHKVNGIEETLERLADMLGDNLGGYPAPSPAGVRRNPVRAGVGTTHREPGFP